MAFGRVSSLLYHHSLSLWWLVVVFLFVKQKTAYEMRISDWSSDVCSSDLCRLLLHRLGIAFGNCCQLLFQIRICKQGGKIDAARPGDLGQDFGKLIALSFEDRKSTRLNSSH